MLAVACIAQFMVVLDISVVNVALPSIRADLEMSEATLQWVVNAYALVFAGFLLVGGRLADVFGVRRVFVVGLTMFTGASIVGGLATTEVVLIGARAAQGLGAAVLAPATLTLITTTIPEGASRTRAVAVWTAIGIAGGTAGNLIGGILTEWVSWRATFLINLPIGLACILLTVVAVTPVTPVTAARSAPPRLDVPGAVLATAALTSLAYGVTQFGDGGSADAGWTALVGAGALIVAFIVVERRAPTPLIPPALVRVRSVRVGNGLMALAGACLNPMWFFLTLTMQNVLGYSPLQTGLAFLPHTVVAIAVGTLLTPRLMRWIQPRTLVAAGALLAAAGFAWQAHIQPGAGYLAAIAGPAIVFSVGAALLNTPLTIAATSGAPAGTAGAASGVMNTAKQAGAAISLAALVGIATPATAAPADLAAAYNRAFLTIAILMALTAVASTALPRVNLQASDRSTAAPKS